MKFAYKVKKKYVCDLWNNNYLNKCFKYIGIVRII